MFRKCSRIVAYALTISIITGTNSVSAMAAQDSSEEMQIITIESTVEETEDEAAENINNTTDVENDNEQVGDQNDSEDSKKQNDEPGAPEQDEDGESLNSDKDDSNQSDGESDQISENEGNLNEEIQDMPNGENDGNQDSGDIENQNDPMQYSDVDESKIDLSGAELFLDEDIFVYDGNAPHPEVTVSLNGTTLAKDSEYEVVYDESPDIGSHLVTIKGIGEYAGSAQAEYKIEKKEQKVSGTASYTKRLGDATFDLNISKDGDGQLVYGSSNNKVVTVTSNGRVTIKGTGTAVINVYAKESAECKKSDVFSVTVKVLKKAQHVTVTTAYNKVIGQPAFKVNASTDGDGALKYSSSNNKVVVIDKNGKATIKGMGISRITIYALETTSFSKSAAKTITVKVSPKKIGISSVSNSANNKATVKWKKQAGITGYQIQYSTKKDYSKAKTVSANTTAVSKVLSGLTKNSTYYVRIRSFKTVGNERLYSAWSASKSIKISKGTASTFAKTPAISVKAHDTELKNIISWKKLSGATGYDVYFKKGVNGSWAKAGSTKTISYTHKVGHGVRYYYKVRAYQDLADGSRIYGKFSKESSMLQYFSPNFSVFMSSSPRSNASSVVLSITNNGVSTLRIYSKDAFMRDYDSTVFNRLLYLTKSSAGHADLAEAKYIDIKPGTSALIAFAVIGNDTWYDKRTRVYYQFRYDGVDYVASSSNYYGTTYNKR